MCLMFLLLSSLLVGQPGLAASSVEAAVAPREYTAYADNALVDNAPQAAVASWRAKSGTSQPGGYLLSPTLVSGQVTVTSRLRFDPEAGTQRLLLSGFSRTMEEPPTLLALSLSVEPGWFSPIISLSIEGEPGLFPEHLRTQSRDFDSGRVSVLPLTDNLTLESGELEAVLSVNLDTGLTAVSVGAPNTTDPYFQGQLYLNPIAGPVYAGMGGFCQECGQSDRWFLELDHFSVAPGGKRLGLPLALSRNVWVHLTAVDDDRPYAGNKRRYAEDELAVWVSGVGPGLPGEFRLVAVSGAEVEEEVWRGRIESADERLLIPGGALRAGRYEIRLEYFEPGYQAVVAQTEVSLGAVQAGVPGEEEWSVRFSPIESGEYTLRIESGPGGAVRPVRVEQLPYGGTVAPTVRRNNITVDSEQVIGSISPLLIGANVIYHLDKDAYWRSDLLPAALKEIKIGFLRYPGGSITSTYHWQNPTGQTWNIDSWSPSFNGQYADPADWMSFDEYMAIVEETGATPLVGINIASGHKFNRVQEAVAEAQAFVRYAREKGYCVKHWFLDNEVYLPQSYVTLTPEEYAGYINLYSEAMREIDPEIKIVINWRQRWEPAWGTILDLAGHNIDYIDMHSYWSWNSATFARWTERPLMRAVNLTYEDTIRLFKSAIGQRGLDIKLSFLEWNVGPPASPGLISPYQAGLMNAETFMQFVRGGLDAAAFWPVHFDGDWHTRSMISRSELSNGRLKPMPVYDVFSLYASVLGDNLIHSESDQEGTLTFAALSQERDRLTVYLLRKDESYTPVSLDLGGFDRATGLANAKIEVRSYAAPKGDLTSVDACMRELPWEFGQEDGRIELAVEPYSLTRVVVEVGTKQ